MFMYVQSIVEMTDEGERGGEMRGVGCRGGRVSKTKIVRFIHALFMYKEMQLDQPGGDEGEMSVQSVRG